MTEILLIPVCTLCVYVAWRFDRRRKRVAEAMRRVDTVGCDVPLNPLAATLFQSGHTWIRIHNDDLVSIGTTDVAATFLGELMTVALPRESRPLHQGDPAWTIVSARGRRLEQVMPIDGKVLAVNNDLLGAPDLVQRHPYDLGWILRVRPHDIHRSILQLLSVAADRLWLEGISARVSERIDPSAGQLVHDGRWMSGLGDRLNDDDWETLRQELFPSDKILGKAS